MPDRDFVEPVLTDPSTAEALASGRHGDPFAVLGAHESAATGLVIRALLPGARHVEIVSRDGHHHLCNLYDSGVAGLFAGQPAELEPYLLRIQWPGSVQDIEDPYSFGPVLGEVDLYLVTEGSHWQLAHRLGAAPTVHEGVAGVRFAVWAPNAQRVSVVGDFNAWDGRRHPMRLRHSAGVWEIFMPRLGEGERYKFEILSADGRTLPLKADPLARATEPPPATASVVAALPDYDWDDAEWMQSRASRQEPSAPISIYEVHAASWLRPKGNPGATLNWIELSERLIPYALERGFTHVEFLPIMEHPFLGSWGYQPLSQFAPSARYGHPKDFARFVNQCHRAGLGVILDWVPAHFPNDAHGLAYFDGTALYEHADPREGIHPDWNTHVYNLGRREVQGFLIASALFWLETFHVDGLRVDAVASMLYRDYSRREGQWIPNRYGGRENLESIEFLRRLNNVVRERCPGAITIAEELTAWPGVSAPAQDGGLGFSFKWNMGWMHDTLRYISRDAVHRRWHHNDITFGLSYAFSERFVLPLSHDEVVHGKSSLFGRAPGNDWDRAATLRAYFAFLWSHPGKKLLFMGGELGQLREWNHDGEIDWRLLEDPLHAGLQRLVSDLNRVYLAEPAFHAGDAMPESFDWLVADDYKNCVFAYLRRGLGGDNVIALFNFTPVERNHYRLGVSHAGEICEMLNTDAGVYGGQNRGNLGRIPVQDVASHGRPYSIELYLPPLSALFLRHEDLTKE